VPVSVDLDHHHLPISVGARGNTDEIPPLVRLVLVRVLTRLEATLVLMDVALHGDSNSIPDFTS
jgi:hypothetical protein